MRWNPAKLLLGGGVLWVVAFGLPACVEPTFEALPVTCDFTRECEERFASIRPELLWECIPTGLCVSLPFCAEPRASCQETLEFQPGLAARRGDGVFEVAPVLQGDPRSIELEAQDRIEWGPGDRLGDTLHERFDLSRGTVLAWITPEWSTSELPPGGAGLFAIAGFGLRVLPDGLLRLERASAAAVEFPGLASGWPAGETRLFVLRWGHAYDRGATEFVVDLGELQGRVVTSHRVDIDLPAPRQLIGVASLDQPSPARARIEGLTVYRRPLFDEVLGMGLDLGQGDELAAIREGRDPAQVTGSWDLLFSLPTAQRVGELGGLGEAYAHPLATDLLAGDGLFASGGGLQGFRLTVGTGLGFLPAAEQRLGLGLTVTGGQPGALLSHDLPLSPGDSFVVRALCWVREGGLGRPRIEVEGDGLTLASIEGAGIDGGATADRPELLLFTGEVDEGTTTVGLHLGVLDGTGPVGCHSIEVHRNLLPNPSLEQGAGTPWVPAGWEHELNPLAVQPSQETVLVHSGSSALRYVADFSGANPGGFAQLRPVSPTELNQEGYYLAGGFFRWISGQSPGISITNGSLFSLTRPVTSGRKFSVRVREGQPDGWIHVSGVGRRWQDSRLNAHNDLVRWGAPEHMVDAELVVDDAYLLPLLPVAIETIPATVAGSHHNGWVRLDGADHLDFPAELAAEEGSVVLVYQRGPVLGAPLAGRDAACTLLELWGDDQNFLRVLQVGDDLRIEGGVAGVLQEHDLSGAAPPASGEHQLALKWRRDQASLRMDAGPTILLPLEERFARDLTRLRLGESASGHRDCDLEVLLPGPWVY